MTMLRFLEENGITIPAGATGFFICDGNILFRVKMFQDGQLCGSSFVKFPITPEQEAALDTVRVLGTFRGG